MLNNMFFKHTSLNGWYLFALVTVVVTIAVLLQMLLLDMADPANVSAMIQFSVRCSVPLLYLAFVASSLIVLMRNEGSRWLLRNRRFIGLSYAAAMGWQLVFILWMVFGHPDYYANEVYAFSDIAVQLPGYLLLFAMTITSFQPGRALLSSKQWKILHRGAIYFLWATVWSTYWYELYYYDDIQPIDYIFYWAGFAAWAIRALAWRKQNHLQESLAYG